MGSACAKGGVSVLEPSDNQAGGKAASTASLNRRASERRGLRHGLVHAGRRVWDHYTVEKEVGHGMTGKVYLVRSKETSELFALKSMDLRRLDCSSVELLEDLKAEVETLRGLDHPNVIKLYEYFVEPSTGGPVQSMFLVLEYCSGGELFDRLHAQPGSRFQELEVAYLVNQMVAAVAYIHSQGITHRDLKLENFIFADGVEVMQSTLKLIDFGLSARYNYSGSGVRRMTTLCGTPYYLAPEVLNQGEGQDGYTNSVDEWSLGVITYMLLSGTPPFKGRRDREVLQAVRRGKYTLSGPRWEGISEEAKDFIRRLLVYNPAKRCSSDQAMKHPWLVGARTRMVRPPAPLDADIVNSLREYRTLTAFKRAALEAIAFSMSAASLAHVREAFAKVDVGSSGTVTLDVFVQVLREAGLNSEEATAIFRSIAPPGSSVISYTEFLAATLNKRALRDGTIRAAFSRLDVDGSGVLTRENLRSVMGDDWTPAADEAFFKEADTNKDGVISADEFTAALARSFGSAQSTPSSGLDSKILPPAINGIVGAMGSLPTGSLPLTALVPSPAVQVPPFAPESSAIAASHVLSAGTGGTPMTVDIRTGTTPPRPDGGAVRQGSVSNGSTTARQALAQAPDAPAFAVSKSGGVSFRSPVARQRGQSSDDVRLLTATQADDAGARIGPAQLLSEGEGNDLLRQQQAS